jgi:hypothetical protein
MQSIVMGGTIREGGYSGNANAKISHVDLRYSAAVVVHELTGLEEGQIEVLAGYTDLRCGNVNAQDQERVLCVWLNPFDVLALPITQDCEAATRS